MGLLTRLLAALTEAAEVRTFISLDCRDQVHGPCDGCDCTCHN